MEYRRLGNSGLIVSALSFGTATFGGSNAFFEAWGTTDLAVAKRQVSIALEHGVTLFDTADAYSQGMAEKILGAALGPRRDDVLIASKGGYRSEPGENGDGNSRFHLIRAVEASLRRLNTDVIDLYQLHGFDPATPAEETLRALDDLVRAGKIRYIGVSNYSAWQLMKALGVSRLEGLNAFVSQQVYYSLIGRDFEWDLMELAEDQGIGSIVWSPLAWGRLAGKIRRGSPAAPDSRLGQLKDAGPKIAEDKLYDIVDLLTEISQETGRSIPQVAINWLLQRPTISSVIMGARTDEQLLDNLGAAGWALSAEQVERLNAATEVAPPYPNWQHKILAPRAEYIR